MKKSIVLTLGLIIITTLTACMQKSSEKLVPVESNQVNLEIPKNCASWFDGCNNCFVDNGKLGGCTRKACSAETMQEPKCLKFTEEKTTQNTEGEIPANCIRWTDGCNTCQEISEMAACTEKYCSDHEPKIECLQFEGEESVNKSPIPEGCVQWAEGKNICKLSKGTVSCELDQFDEEQEIRCLKFQ